MEDKQDEYSGHCFVCGEQSVFRYTGGSIRESYSCNNCRASLRYRHQASVLIHEYGKDERSLKALKRSRLFRKMDIYEPGVSGPFRRYFKRLPNYERSFYWDEVPLGEEKDGVVNQDLQNLTYKSGSFDLVISSDIFEHIRSPFKAFEEIKRVLKAGGKHIFTVPVSNPISKETVSRVDTRTHEDIYLLPKRYHGNGAGGKSLVYTDFGEDVLERLKIMGLPTRLVRLSEEGPLDGKHFVFVSEKIGRRTFSLFRFRK